MYIFKNALKNLNRNRGRNLIVGLILIAIIVTAVVGLTMQNAANRMIEDTRLDIGSRVDIGIDLFNLSALGLGPEGRESLTIDQYMAFGESDYLAYAIFEAQVPVFSATVFAIDDESFGQSESPDPTLENLMTMKIVGTSSPDYLPDFGTDRHIAEGRMFEAVNEVIISEELAAHNGLRIGNTIEVESVFRPVQVFELTIVGIYSDETPMYTDFWMEMFGMFFENRRNEIITGLDTILAAGFVDDSGIDMQAQYFLRNPDYLPYFEAEVRALGLPEIFDVSINQEALDVVTGPLNSMRSTALVFTIIILALGAIVLTLLSYMAIRERKYEVGVLRAMGMGKSSVLGGIFFETIAITALCLVLGLGIGTLAAQPIANALLSHEVAVAVAGGVDEDGGLFLMAGGQAQTNNPAAGFTPISEIELALGADIILQIALISLALAVLSVGVAIIQTTKYEPMRILSESRA